MAGWVNDHVVKVLLHFALPNTTDVHVISLGASCQVSSEFSSRRGRTP